MAACHILSDGRRVYTVKQAAAFFGVQPATIYQWRYKGMLRGSGGVLTFYGT
jgi:transposase-like protein